MIATSQDEIKNPQLHYNEIYKTVSLSEDARRKKEIVLTERTIEELSHIEENGYSHTGLLHQLFIVQRNERIMQIENIPMAYIPERQPERRRARGVLKALRAKVSRVIARLRRSD